MSPICPHVVAWVRLIKNKQLMALAARHPTCRPAVNAWKRLMLVNTFTDFVNLRQVFPHADQVTVASRRTVTIFNLGRNFRLITAIHYNQGRVYILRLFTHSEYDNNQWKSDL